ncbi:dynein axonemal intermediate chain 4 [Pholidichthys leucotaenia]
MSTSVGREEQKTRRILVLRPSSRAVNMSVSGPHGASLSSRLGSVSRRNLCLGAGSKVLEKSNVQTHRQAVRVFDEEDVDVTPQPLYQADPAAVPTRFFVEELSAGSVSDQTTITGSFTMPFSRSIFGSSRISSQSTIESVNEEIEDTFSKRDLPTSFPDVKGKKETVKDHVTEDMLKEVISVFITETDTFSLLDIPSTIVSVDAGDAETIKEKNMKYAELCKNRMGNDKYVERSMQTLNGEAKSKHVQSGSVVLVDAETNLTSLDMYQPLCEPEQEETVGSHEPEKADYSEAVVGSSQVVERSMSVGSIASTVSVSSSLKEVDPLGNSLNADSELQLIMESEEFQHCLLLMERSIMQNIFQPQLAAYKQLPVLEDPASPVKSETMEQGQGATESSHSPALEPLWVFSCELSRERRINCMAWNKKNPDLLAVGYGNFESSEHKPGLVCCWSIKNPTWPERVLHCDSAVTSLDFSANSPSHLAVGTHDGTIAIYNVCSQDNRSLIVSSSECPNRHLGPVWQLRWTHQGLNLTEEEMEEALVSVGEDGRISKWFVFNNGLDCVDLMKLKKIHNAKRKAGGNKTAKTTESVPLALTPGLCFDFHPTDYSIYLAGTWEGLIHKCSSSNSQQFLETYKKHFCPVNCVTWSPFHHDVFLSCSSDWTIQLWKQDHLNPILDFSSTQSAVFDVKWSPKWATVFGVVNEAQLEIWDLNSNILGPVIKQPAAPGVMMTSLLFAAHTDCVVVGDDNGEVTVYKLKNLSVGPGKDDGQSPLLCCIPLTEKDTFYT